MDTFGPCEPARDVPSVEPKYPQAELADVVPRSRSLATFARSCDVDGSEFSEFKAKYGKTCDCALHRVHGRPVDRANNGVVQRIRAQGSAFHRAKRTNARFRCRSCIAGFMVGRDYEAGGTPSMAPRWSPRWPARGCLLTVRDHGSYGAGNYSMCGRAYCPGSCGCGLKRADLGDGR